MFTDLDRRIKNWRSDKRTLRRLRNKRKKLERQLKNGRHTTADKPKLKEALANVKVQISVFELRVGDKPE